MVINEKRRVVITGLGLRSPIGNSVDLFFDSILNGETEFSTVDFIKLGVPLKASFFKNYKEYEHTDLGFTVTELAHKLLLGATQDALQDAGVDNVQDEESTIAIIGTTSGGSNNEDVLRDIYLENQQVFPELAGSLQSLHAPSSYLGKRLGLKLGSRTLMNACSSGIHTIGYGSMLIQNNCADRVIAGGLNTLGAIPLLGFYSIGVTAKDKIRPFDAEREGLFLGEGVAILILESLELAKVRNAKILGEVRGFSAFGNYDELGNLTKPTKDGYLRCMSIAIKRSGLEPDSIDFIHAHGTATVSNDSAEATAIKECFPASYHRIPVSSTKSSTGHLLGAAGAIASLICIKAINESIVPPNKNLQNPDSTCEGMLLPVKPVKMPLTHVLCNSFGFGGNDTSIVISKFEE